MDNTEDQNLANAARALNLAAEQCDSPASTEQAVATKGSQQSDALNQASVTSKQSDLVEPTSTMEPKAKKNKNHAKAVLIAGGVIAVLGLGGLGTAYAIANTPENIALSAVASVFATKQKHVSSTFSLNLKDGKVVGIKSAQLTLDADINTDKEVSTTAELAVNFYDTKIKLSLDTVILKDYTVYIKINQLKAAAKAVLEHYDQSIKSGDFNASHNDSDDYTSTPPYEDIINQLVGKIDGEWWRISIPELIDVDEKLSAKEKVEAKKTYGCIVNFLSDAKTKVDYAELYKKHAFISLQPYEGDQKFDSEGKAYIVQFSSNKIADFGNALTSSFKGLGVKECLPENVLNDGSDDDVDGDDKLSANDVDEMIRQWPTTIITVKNNFFSHEVTGLYSDLKTDSDFYTGTVKLNFSNQVKEVKAPANAQSITKFSEEINRLSDL